jgi:hypothetical protein
VSKKGTAYQSFDVMGYRAIQHEHASRREIKDIASCMHLDVP